MSYNEPLYLDPERSRKIFVYPHSHYAKVVLDRDDFLDRTGKPLASGILDAVDECAKAAHERIWLNGGPSGFVRPHNDRWVAIQVPYENIEQAVEALRVAELHGDLSKLGALALHLRISFDKWLTPGLHEVRRGIDFACTPDRFSTIIKLKAKQRGIELIARPTGFSVVLYVGSRASLPPSLRSALPPAPSRRREDPRQITDVRFIGEPLVEKSCPCGWHGTSTTGEHDKWHALWAAGVPIPKNLQWSGHSVAVVSVTAPRRWRNLAYRCARLVQREQGYDFASYPHPSSGPKESRNDERVYLYQENNRVIGYLATRYEEFHWQLDLVMETSTGPNKTRRPVIGLIFVAHGYRGKGIASKLLRTLALDTGVQPSGLSWAAPFSEEGAALARRFSQDNKVWTTR